MYSYATIIRHKKPPAQKPARDQPLDAADLSRRLTAHLTAQETAQRRHSLRSRITRPLSTSAAVEDTSIPSTSSRPQHQSSSSHHHQGRSSAHEYRHVPTHPALSFARTATPEPKGLVHRLSAPVLREHLRRANESGDGFSGSVQRAKEIDRARRQRQERGERNAWQWGRDMNAVREGDERRGVYREVKRGFGDGEREKERERAVPPMAEQEEERERKRRSLVGFEGRGDWAQQEESVGVREETGKKGLRDIIRRFGLGKRKAEKDVGIRPTAGKEDVNMELEKFASAEAEAEVEGKKGRRSSLLARLKWHPGHAVAHKS